MIPHLEEVKLAVQSIGTLASLIKIWQTARSTGADVSPAQVDNATKAKLVSVSNVSLQQLTQVIPRPVVEAIRDIIEDAIKRLASALRDPTNTPQDKDKEEQIAKVTICRELNRIKRLNNGDLPDGLDEYWISFGCV